MSRQPRGFPAGHFYSPLLDVAALRPEDRSLPFDGYECWEHIDLRRSRQQAYYERLFRDFPPLEFPARRSADFRYQYDNDLFPLGDAQTLSSIIRRERPNRIIEVGCGFSSAVMLDTIERDDRRVALTFIDPFSDRWKAETLPADAARTTYLAVQVQKVPMVLFEQLGPRDILFIDSSHVAKVGSDVAYLFLRVLPRLKPGVLVHFHDIFYPHSYPIDWIRRGWAWNESLFLRAFLIGNQQFEIVAFNAFATAEFPELFRDLAPGFLERPGGSLWLRKVG